MKFSKLTLKGWRQFETVDIDFHPKLTVITGANGAGKSTLLQLLSQQYGWTRPLLAAPSYSSEGVLGYLSGIFDLFRAKPQQPMAKIGTLGYADAQHSEIMIPTETGIQYQVAFSPPRQVQGLDIGSHSSPPGYRQVGNIPTSAMSAAQAYQLYYQEMQNLYNTGYSQFPPVYRMKEAIISMATFGPGNKYVKKNAVVEKLFEDFKIVLAKTLPPTIGFKNISIVIPDVVVETTTGDFVIDAASGGLMSLIDLSWRIFLYAADKQEFIVTIDEPENHLHPSMQRALLNRLLSAFPQAQFIVATHSPFIVSSVKDSSVYVLKYNVPQASPETKTNSRIVSLKLDSADKAGTASEILRDVLGVPVTLPEWAEEDLRRISAEFQIENFNSVDILRLRERLDQAGLGEYYPEALRSIVETR